MPDPDAWFQEVFGDEFGNYFAKQYRRGSRNIAAQLENEFKSLLNQKQTSLDIFRFDKTCDQCANDEEYPILRVRKKHQVLYEARFSNPQVYNSMWFFAHINGAFRYVGHPQMPIRRMMIPVRGDASDRPKEGLRLAYQVPPVYLLFPRNRMETDLIRLQLFVNPDGTVKDLYVIRGRCNFSESLFKAARQWRFDVPDYMKSGQIPWVYEFSFGGAR